MRIKLEFFCVLIALGGLTGCTFKNPKSGPPIASVPGSPPPGVSLGSGPAASPSAGSNPQDWEEKLLKTEQNQLVVKTLRPTLREQLKAKFSIPELEEIRSDYSGSFNLYRVKNREESRRYVFIEPKIYVYGTAQGGNVLTVSSDSGRKVSITFPVSFVDGLVPVVPAYSGKGAVSIPEGLRIPNPEKLKEDLKQKLGTEIILQALPTCSRELSLVYSKGDKSKRYQLRPTLPMDRRCSMNEFFTVSLTSGRSEVMDLIQSALGDGLGLQLTTKFQVDYRTPVAFYDVKFGSRAIYEKIRRQFVSFAFGSSIDPKVYLSYQLNPVLHDLLLSEVQALGPNGSWFPSSQGIQLLQDTYFDEVTGDLSCPFPNRCFKVKDESDVNFDLPLELVWIEEETLGLSAPLSLVTFVKGLAESFPIHVAGQINEQTGVPVLPDAPSKQVCDASQGNLPGCPGFSCELFPDNVYCKSRSRKAVVHQFQVFPGAKLKLAFDRITQWSYELPIPREDTPDTEKKGEVKCADNQVLKDACVEYESDECVEYKNDFCAKPKDECDEPIKLFEDHCRDDIQFETNCGFLGLGVCTIQLKNKTHTCEKVEYGQKCLRYKTSCDVKLEQVCVRKTRKCKKYVDSCNQYTVSFFSKYSYSEPWIRPKTIDMAQGATLEELWDGLDIEFSWLDEEGKKVEHLSCPIKAFSHVIEGYSITLNLENQDGSNPCKPFNQWNIKEGRWPEVAIVNHIHFDRKYLCGFLEWTHSVNVNPASSEHTIDRLLYTCPESGEKSDHPIVRTYQPIVDLDGSVSILGRSLDTTSAGKTRSP